MQKETLSPIQKQLRASVGPDDIFVLIRVDNGLQVNLKKASEKPKNITVGISKAFGLPLAPSGLLCTPFALCEALAEACLYDMHVTII